MWLRPKGLFQNKCYVIVEKDDVPAEIHNKVCELVKLTGANLTTLDIAKHDRCASVISHIPHVAAAALVTLLNRSHGDQEACLKLAGGGFKDTTRIASSNADMWADICMTNSEAIINHIHLLQGILGKWLRLLPVVIDRLSMIILLTPRSVVTVF